MSFDLLIFERRKELQTSVDICEYLEQFTEYQEDTDYDSPNDSSAAIYRWAKKMFERFPPTNGPYAVTDAVAYATEESRKYFADYSIGKHAAYVAFAWSVSDEALAFARSIADEYGVGIYDPQSNDALFGKGIEILKYRTEGIEDVFCDWDNVERVVRSLDDPERGTSNRDNAFVTVWYERDGETTGCVQCTPNYSQPTFGEKLFGKKSAPIQSYTFEIVGDGCIFSKTVPDKEELLRHMKQFCVERRDFELSEFEKMEF